MFKKKEKRIFRKKGFTLVETLISISILMISVAAPLSLAAKGIQAANLAKQQIVAYYLAQDAYEWVKNKTDSNKLNNETYADDGLVHGLSDCFGDDTVKCKINTLDNNVSSYSDNDFIGFAQSSNTFSYGVGYDDTIYKRYIHINKIVDNGTTINEVEVAVTIEWNIPYIGDQKYILKGHITN